MAKLRVACIRFQVTQRTAAATTNMPPLAPIRQLVTALPTDALNLAINTSSSGEQVCQRRLLSIHSPEQTAR